MSDPNILLGLVGDLLVDRDDPPTAFAAVADAFGDCDVLLGNLEGAYTDDPQPAPSVGIPVFPTKHNVDAFSKVGFNVLALANNHICDSGHAALLETQIALNEQGVLTCGAGKNLAAARKPAILEVSGLRLAFLSYASVFPIGYEARSDTPGLAPFRAYDLCRSGIENYHAPGTPPRITSVPDEGDLENLRADIEAAKKSADLVIVSFHWGDFLRPFHLTDHETRTARWCIDQGVDMVVGHHHHALRGMEWYKGKPILYGLGHFVFDFRFPLNIESQKIWHAEDEYGIHPREGWPLLPLHPDTRMTMLAWARLGANGVSELGFLPCWLTPTGEVVPKDAISPDGRQVLDYVARCNSSQKLNGSIAVNNDFRLGGLVTAKLHPLT